MLRCCVRRTAKGWSVFAEEEAAAGAFVCLYAGELLSRREAELRLRAYDLAAERPGHALLVVREVLPSGRAALRMNVDATRQGNVAAFINHSCDGGNLRLEVVRRRGALLPAVALVASRRIASGDELAFAYGLPNAGRPGGRRCLCGTPACLGFLPAEPTQD